jgi:pimeloyl-ACP methyl ester carboxylesterase
MRSRRGVVTVRSVTAWANGVIQPQFRTIDGLAIRFAESERRDDEALLLSPWPESLFAFEPTWLRLAEHTHLVAIDLPGFGHSQRDDALLSLRAMGEFVVRVADTFGLETPHVVAPNVGTGAALYAASLHPGRLRSLVVGGGPPTGALQPDLEVVLGGLERPSLPEHVREDYLSSYQGDRFAESIRCLRSHLTEVPGLAGLLPRVQTPVQIIAGRRDRLVPALSAEFLHARLPRSKLDVIDAGHFTWEDAPDQYAALVTSWWGGGSTTAVPY